MAISEHVKRFAGKPVKDFDPAKGVKDPARTIYRLRLSYDQSEGGKTFGDLLNVFLEQPGVDQTPGIVIGAWDYDEMVSEASKPVVKALVDARARLPAVKAIFLGDITFEECEISWLNQCDVSPLFKAYPQLEYFTVRGNQGLSLGTLQHKNLKALTVETGGLSRNVVREVCKAKLPELEHLELWLGEENYGWDGSVQDLRPILAGKPFPKLRYLGLRDSAIADEVAAATANAPVLERVRVLDLSLGNLGDEGAKALLASPGVAQLEKLDIHHHYVSKELVKKLKALGIEVDASEQKEPDVYGTEVYRYIAVSE